VRRAVGDARIFRALILPDSGPGQPTRLVLACRGLDVVKTEYGKALGEGLYEFRIRWTAAEISHKLSGYDKARHSSDRWQQREIAEARRYLASYRERQRRIK
jgi:hypothetical protein